MDLILLGNRVQHHQVVNWENRDFFEPFTVNLTSHFVLYFILHTISYIFLLLISSKTSIKKRENCSLQSWLYHHRHRFIYIVKQINVKASYLHRWSAWSLSLFYGRKKKLFAYLLFLYFHQFIKHTHGKTINVPFQSVVDTNLLNDVWLDKSSYV